MFKNLILFLVFTAFVITSCKKEHNQLTDNKQALFADAKEWFETDFKKTKEWDFLLRKESGVTKLNWSKAKYSKKEALELIEVPLDGKPSSIAVPTINLANENQENLTKVLANSSKSLLIGNRGGNYFVVQKEYIPNLENIIETNNNDDNLISGKKPFNGRIVYLSYTGEIISFSEVADDNVKSSYHKSGISTVNSNSQKVNSQESTTGPLCIVITIIRYSWTCFPVYIHDGGTMVMETICTLFSDGDQEEHWFCPDPDNGCADIQCTEYGVMSGYVSFPINRP